MNNQQTSIANSLTIEDQLSWASQLLTQTLPSSDSPQLDSKLLLCHCLVCNTTFLHTWPDKLLTEQQQQAFQQLIYQRSLGKPIAYLIGYREFWTLKLQVSDATLIPRPETELLVETALECLLPHTASVLDLGTGTGAVALALASEKANWHILGIDKSAEAVALAKKNAELNQLNSLVFKQSDWFSCVSGQTFDLIVSNPPYVESNSPYLSQGDVRFEPLSALISGEDGLNDIRLIIAQATSYLISNGWLMLEHGFEQGAQIRYLFESNGYVDIRTVLDLNSMPRVTMAKYCIN